jgi:hypothetical protein
MEIGFRLAHADPGRDVSNATIFILCTYTSTEVIYKTTDIPLTPSSRSPLLSSPGHLSLFSPYLAEFGASAGSDQRYPPPHVHSSMAM